MQVTLKKIVVAMCLTGLYAQASYAYAISLTDAEFNEKLSSQVSTLQKQLNALKEEIKGKPSVKLAANQPKQYVSHEQRVAKQDNVAKHTQQGVMNRETPHTTSHSLTGHDLVKLIGDSEDYLPFDLDVPGQAFVSTGPYVGVPVQYSGSNLIINSPSVNVDLQLLGIRKGIHAQQKLFGEGALFKEPYHSHLLLSGLVEAQANYTQRTSQKNISNIDVTNVSLDAFFIGPSDWLLGFIEFTYDGGLPSGEGYRVNNSRFFVNKAFVTIGDLEKSPIYSTFGQFYVPFGSYASLMVSDPLPRLLGRTKARAIQLGFQQQSINAFYGAVYAFRGDSYLRAPDRINNGGINLGYKFKLGNFTGNVGGGVLANFADSGGMQLGNGFTKFEKLHHRVPAIDVRGLFNVGQHYDVIIEYIMASSRFRAQDMSYKGHGAKPWALDTQVAHSFYILGDRPSSVGVGFGESSQALTLGIPLTRTSAVFNTSLWRNTLQSVEFRHDQNYAKGATGNGPTGTTPGACTAFTCTGLGKSDNAVTAQFDYYF